MTRPDRFLLAGVMGWPVMHSRSPMMHNHWLAEAGLAGAYVPLAIRPEGLEAALRALHPLGFSGVNLTIPHKSRAMAAMDEIDPVGRAVGAISCVTVRPDGGLHGTNNDWLGFLGNLDEAFPGWRADAGPAVVIGAGGGARGVVYALASRGAPEIRVVNRTRGRAEALAGDLEGPIRPVDWTARADALEGAALLVNATSQGMVGQPPLDLALDRLPPSARVADIVYTPLETPLLAEARRRGHAAVNGLGMLLHQGIPAWRSWFGVEPRVTPALRRLMEESIAAR